MCLFACRSTPLRPPAVPEPARRHSSYGSGASGREEAQRETASRFAEGDDSCTTVPGHVDACPAAADAGQREEPKNPHAEDGPVIEDASSPSKGAVGGDVAAAAPPRAAAATWPPPQGGPPLLLGRGHRFGRARSWAVDRSRSSSEGAAQGKTARVERCASMAAEGELPDPCPTGCRRTHMRSLARQLSGVFRVLGPRKQPAAELRKTLSMPPESSEVPALSVPSGTQPLTVRRLPHLPLRRIREALEAEGEHGLLEVVLRDAFGGHSVTASRRVVTAQGGTAQRTKYLVPIPPTIPDLITKTFKVPKELPGCMLTCFGELGDALVFVQLCWTDGVMFSDRFRLRTTHVFSELDGGTEWRQFVEVVWTEQLPWSLRFMAKIIERTTMDEARASTERFAACLEKATAE